MSAHTFEAGSTGVSPPASGTSEAVTDVAVGESPHNQLPKQGAHGRLIFLDRIRVLLIALVVLHHAAVTYSDIPAWYYYEKPTDGSAKMLDIFIIFNQAFFMGLFFALSAYLVPSAVARKGTGTFLSSRLWRLGVPLVVFYFVINPLTSVLGDGYKGSFLEAYPSMIGPGPLWFVELLLVLTLGYVAWRSIFSRRGEAADTRSAEGYKPLGFTHLGILVAGIAVTAYLWRTFVPQEFWVTVFDFPSAGFIPQYAGLFIAGVIAYRRGWFSRMRKGLGRVCAAIAFVSLLAYLGLTVASLTQPTPQWMVFLTGLCETAFCIAICVVLLRLCAKLSRRETKLGRYLAQHSYTVFVIHAPVLVAVSLMFTWLAAPAIVKFGVVGLIAVPVTFGVAFVVRKIPGVAKFL